MTQPLKMQCCPAFSFFYAFGTKPWSHTMGQISILTHKKKSLREVNNCLSLLLNQFQAHHSHLLGKPQGLCTFMVFKMKIKAEWNKRFYMSFIFEMSRERKQDEKQVTDLGAKGCVFRSIFSNKVSYYPQHWKRQTSISCELCSLMAMLVLL